MMIEDSAGEYRRKTGATSLEATPALITTIGVVAEIKADDLSLLKVELQRKLNDARIESICDAPEVRTIDVPALAGEEVSVIKDIEELGPKLDVCMLGEIRPFDKAQIEVPVSRSARRRQM